MKIDYIPTKSERREKKKRLKMAVSGRNTTRLAQNIARKTHLDQKARP
jgi:hypothetical protein